MAAIWDDGTTSSSDGQYFRAAGRAGAGGSVAEMLYTVEKPSTWPLLAPLTGDAVETAAILGQWAELMRLKASIVAGSARASADRADAVHAAMAVRSGAASA